MLGKTSVRLGQHVQLDFPTTVRDCAALCEYLANANEPLQQDPEPREDGVELATLAPWSSVQALIGPMRMAGPNFVPDPDRAAYLQGGRRFLVFAYYPRQGCPATFRDLPVPLGRMEASIWCSSLYFD